VGTAVTFAAAMAGGTVLHVGIAPARRVVAAAVNQVLLGTFRGKIAITRLGTLRANRVDGVDATLSTHDGQRVILAQGVRARVALGPLLWSLVRGRDMQLTVTEVSVDHVDALLEQGADGQLTVATAFQPATEGPPPPPKKSSSGLDLSMPRIAIDSAWVHGALGGAPLDVSVERLAAAFAMTPTQMSASGSFVGQARGIARGDDIDLDVKGGLDKSVIDATVHATTGKATVAIVAHGSIPSDTDPDTDAKVTVTARDLDAKAFGGPPSAIGIDTAAHAHVAASGDVTGDYDVRVLAGKVAAQPTPETHLVGTFTRARVSGTAHVAEAGAPTDLRYDVALAAKGGPDISFNLKSHIHDLHALPQLRGALNGSAVIEAQGRASLGAKTIDAKLETRLDGFSSGGVAVRHLALNANARGALMAPAATLSLAASELRVASLEFPTVAASASGTPDDLAIHAKLDGQQGRQISADAHVAASDGVKVRDTVVTVSRAKDSVTLRVASLRSKDGRLDVEGVQIDGAGAPLTAEAHLRPGSVAARVHTDGLDLGTLARFIEGEKTPHAGCVAMNVDVTATRWATKGHATLEASNVTDGKFIKNLTAKLAATFDGRAVEAHLDARDVKLGHVTLDTDGVKLASGGLDPRAWRDATGKVHLQADVDLAKATQASPIDLPIEQASGSLSAKVDVTRDDAKRQPSVAMDATTKSLAFTTIPGTVPNDDGTVTIVKKPFHSQDIDAHVTASVDAQSGKAKVDAQLHDKVGPLIALSAGATLPTKAIFKGDAAEALLATAVTLHAEVPVRSLETLPPMLGTLPIRGQMGFTLDATGNARTPHVVAEVQAKNIIDGDDPTPIPINFDTKLDYDGNDARVTIAGTRPEGRVLDASATMKLRVTDVLDQVSPLPWEANADVKFDKLPIGAIADFVNQELDGNLTGTISLHDLHKAGELSAKLDLDDIVLSGAKFPHATASLDVKDGALAAKARIDETDGFAEVDATAAMKWGAEIAPSPDETKSVDLKLGAKNFRAIALAPFVQGALDQLDGILNANAVLHIKPGYRDGAMEGAIVFSKGVIESPVVGEAFHDVTARIFMKPWGLWNVQELSGRATSGKFTATAQAQMNGFHLQKAEAHLKIAQREKIPLTMQGTALGTAWGQIDAKGQMTPDGKRVDIDVNVPNFHVDLDDATGHGVESTDPDATLAVGIHDKHGKMELLAYDGTKPVKLLQPKKPEGASAPMAIHLVTHLGPDLEIRRGTMVKVYVGGGPIVDVGARTKVSGVLTVPNGYIELQGKRFNVEKADVTFTGQEPNNPLVQAAAVYDSPDGTKVYAKFAGPARTGKLTLESDPQLSQNEILSLLMFGSADGTFGQAAPPGEQGNDTTQAASLAGGVVTQGLNKAISGVSGVEVETSVDTQQTGNPRPEVEVALSRKVSATVMYSLGVPPPGESPDDTLLLIDWRFHKNYSTEATLGDKGTTILDLAWKYRY
jgi:translocation and assembly module TamB